MSDTMKGLVDQLNEGHVVDLAVPEEASRTGIDNAVQGPEEILEKIEAFVSIGFNAEVSAPVAHDIYGNEKDIPL